MNRPTVKVFLPTAALKNETCLLLGRKNKQHNTCCVTNYLLIQDLSVIELEKVVSCDIEVIGILINESAGYDPETLDSCQTYLRTLPEWIIMKRSDGDLPVCTVYGKWQDYNLRTYVIVLLFSAEDVHASYLLESESPNTNLGQLYSGWQHGITFQKSCEHRNINVIKGFVSKDTGWTSDFSVAIQRHLSRLCLLFTSLITWISNRSIFTCSSICRYIPRPAVFCQLEYKSRKLHNSIIQQHHSRVDEIRLTGVLWQQILDVILGVTVMLCVRCHSETIGSAIMQSAEVVAAELEQLLKWMMGVPAGLKLNKELTNFLGQFFMYHIYLWKGYLWFLYPLWADAVWCISLSGCLGLSTQLSLIQDLLSVMTLHCYCFYVYAARLYSLQVYALRSLWRLFRGKKWNPLFQRVDSSSYDVDQLFIGTLLFTILLFLLPTTGLYYAVFTGLRLLVLAIQGSLYKLVAIIDYLSLYALYLKVITPNKIAADVQLHVHTRNSHQPLFHTIQLHPTSLSKLFCLINSPSSSKVEDTWKVFLTKLITGKLIYPWIE